VDPATTDKLLGLFEPGDMNYEVDRTNPTFEAAGEPSLAEMTEKAIQILRKNSEGFFLFVEGGRIDHGHHASEAFTSLNDFIAFDNAIQKAVDMTSESDTLIMVTADHSHTFNIGGNAVRGNPLFGFPEDNSSPKYAEDGKPFTSLLYGNGPAWGQGGNEYPRPLQNQIRKNLTSYDLAARGMKQQSAVARFSESHGAEDVAIFARGPMSHLVHKTHEQSYIAYVMRYAACLGNDTRHCDEISTTTEPPTEPTSSVTSPNQETTTTNYKPFVVQFLGRELSQKETLYALYTQFILCIVLFLFYINQRW